MGTPNLLYITHILPNRNQRTAMDEYIVEIAGQKGLQPGEEEISPHVDGDMLARGEAEAAFDKGNGPLYLEMVEKGFPKCKDASQFFTNIANYVAKVTTPRYRMGGAMQPAGARNVNKGSDSKVRAPVFAPSDAEVESLFGDVVREVAGNVNPPRLSHYDPSGRGISIDLRAPLKTAYARQNFT